MVSENSALPFYERLFALGVAGFFLSLIVFNLWMDEGELSKDLGKPIPIKDLYIEVTVEGKVEHPGVYRVKKGESVKKVVEMAKPMAGSNLKRVKLDGKITQRRKITIR